MGHQIHILWQVALAALLGSVIGAEREFFGKAAGLRTHMMVAAASALFLRLGTIIVSEFAVHADGGIVSADPIRVIQAIVTGISFLGAGTIVFHRKRGAVEGLTTAASILLVSAIGMTVAMGQIILATGVTFGALLVLIGIGYLEDTLIRNRRGRSIHREDDL